MTAAPAEHMTAEGNQNVTGMHCREKTGCLLFPVQPLAPADDIAAAAVILHRSKEALLKAQQLILPAQAVKLVHPRLRQSRLPENDSIFLIRQLRFLKKGFQIDLLIIRCKMGVPLRALCPQKKHRCAENR